MTEKMSLDKSKMGGTGGSHTIKACLSCPQIPLGTAIDPGNRALAAGRNLLALHMALLFLQKHGAFTRFL